jgi:hypothetical protein
VSDSHEAREQTEVSRIVARRPSPVAPSALDKLSPHAHQYVPFFFFFFTDQPLTAPLSPAVPLTAPLFGRHQPPSSPHAEFAAIELPSHIWAHSVHFPLPIPPARTPAFISTRACRWPETGSHVAPSPCPSIVFTRAHSPQPSPSHFDLLRRVLGTSSACAPVVYTGSIALPADAPIVRYLSSCLVPASSRNPNPSLTVTASMTIVSGPLWGGRYVGLPSGPWRQFCRVLKNLPLQGPGSTGSGTGGYQAAVLKFGV